MSKLHLLLQSLDIGLGNEIAEDVISIGQRGGRTLTGGDGAVLLPQGARVDSGGMEMLLPARRAGGTLAVEDADRGQDSGGGTDGGNTTATVILPLQSLTDTSMLVEVLAARHASGEHQQVGITEVAILKKHVSLNSDSMRGLDKLTARNTDSLDFNATTTKNIDGSQSFYLFKAIG